MTDKHLTISNPYSSYLDETSMFDRNLLVVKTKESHVWFEGIDEPYVDLFMAYSSTNFGHCNDKLINHLIDCAQKFDNLPAFNSVERRKLDEKILSLINKPANYKTYYTVGGAKAIETGIKLARAKTKKNDIITFSGNFHGYSYGAMMVTDDHFINKSQFGTMPGINIQFDFPDSLELSAHENSQRILIEIKTYLNSHKNSIAAMIFEPIQGAAGFIVPPPSFLTGLQELALEFDIVTICDEIQTGVGRTMSFLQINNIMGLVPDIILLGKSLCGGFYPLSAVVAKSEIFASVSQSKSGFDSTFSNNNLGIAMALKVLDFFDESLKSCLEVKSIIIERYLKGLQNLQIVDRVTSIGYGFTIKFKRSDHNPGTLIAKSVVERCFAKKVIIHTTGCNGDYIKITPSFYIDHQLLKDSMETVVDIVNELNNENVNVLN